VGDDVVAKCVTNLKKTKLHWMLKKAQIYA